MPDGTGAPVPLPEDIFNDALDLPPEQREAFVMAACVGDSALRQLINDMLGLAARESDLLSPPDTVVVPPHLGKYELLSELGRGGMGVVYAARDHELDRVVALKLLPAAMARDQASRDRFRREARLLASLSDERIATLYTLEEAQGFHFLTMEYIRGRTLAEVLGDGPLPLLDTVRIGQQIAEALAVAHARGVIHRDLKPQNIMLLPSGGVKILDFGIARALREDDQSGDESGDSGPATTFLGTPGYMAPEQTTGAPVDHRCDIWGLARVLLVCTSGLPPLEEVGSASTNAPPRLEDLPRDFARVLDRSLVEDSRLRETSAEQVARDLAAVRRRLLSRSRQRRTVWIAILIMAAAAFGLFATRTGPAPAVSSIDIVDTRILRAKSERDDLLWARSMPAGIVRFRGGRDDAITVDSPKIVQVDGRTRLVVVATSGTPENPTGSVWGLSPWDGHTLWRWEATWERPVNALGTLNLGWSEILPWPGGKDPIIAVDLGDGGWYGSAVAFLDLGGNSLGTYHHPGSIRFVTSLPASSTTPLRYVLFGLNSSARFIRELVPFESREHCGCVAILEPPLLAGQGYPYSQGLPEPRDWPGMPRAQEIAYLAIPLLHPQFSSRVISYAITTLPDGGRELAVETADGRIFFLDERLQPRSCYVAIDTVADSLQARGEAQFLPLLHISEGITEHRDVPIEF